MAANRRAQLSSGVDPFICCAVLERGCQVGALKHWWELEQLVSGKAGSCGEDLLTVLHKGSLLGTWNF